MITKYDKTLNSILEANAGIITSAEAQEAGATRPAFSDYVRRRGLEKTSRGVYLDPDVFPDEMALLQKRFPKAAFSHESALYLHDLTDREPVPISVTVESSYNASPLKAQGVRIYYTKPEWYEMGLAEVETPSGAKVRAYDKERTICDLIRKRTAFDPAVFRQAIRDYVRSRDKNLARLSDYARAMNIESRVYEVMEVAL
ncbi:abortive phage infection protein [Enterorhabdus mucosicola]|uniref:Abortive phage infection protein n=1 Tax=Adlercreutzia mucosicola TaxID=580026 RepID=A0A6N8JMP0_9ACTN|nr:type IV toxin-antitoxin system AbiEi family antitoxin domain-containing protein [Adlercreutzia mucosicola]MVX60096.1 abortive phage infection protein [Adlercreutzia mucosicola]